ncbi:MAG: hypothetical protein WCJ30_23120, partial [Deltaproteobacteria bacterium]
PLVAKEWPALDGEALAKTDGDLERVVALVVQATAQSEPFVRGKLEELLALASRPANTNDSARARDPLIELLERLEKKTTELASELRGSVLPTAREKVKDNLLVSLLVALGLGFILGVIFTMGGRRRDR